MDNKIFEMAHAPPPVRLASARQYQDKMETMLRKVDQELTRRTDILSLIGKSPIEMMKANHRYHVGFMSTVFRLNMYNLLARVVVWVYRSYHSRGFSYEYFIIELHAWKNAVSTELDAAAAVEINRVYQWMIDHHQDFIGLAEEKDYETFSFSENSQQKARILLTHMLDNNFGACIELAVESVHSVEDLAYFYQEIMTPALYEIGRLWEEGQISAVQEHLATAISMRIMAGLYGGFVVGEPDKGAVVVTAAPNEFHEVGARMVSDQLEMDGWKVEYLGANSPLEDLLELLRQDPPFILAISVVMPFNIETVRQIIEIMKNDALLKQIRVMVGGRAFSLETNLWQKVGADGYAGDSWQAVLLSRKWWNEKAG